MPKLERAMENLLNLAARVLMAQIFIISGYGKITGYAATQGYMASMGVPGALLPLVIFAELAGGLAILFGFKTRWAAAGLAVFTLLSAVIFHRNISDQTQFIHFMKNLGMTGGLLMLVRYGAGKPSIDEGATAHHARKRSV
jgi:putative oxidoreductase